MRTRRGMAIVWMRYLEVAVRLAIELFLFWVFCRR
jgi:hypothetical protein